MKNLSSACVLLVLSLPGPAAAAGDYFQQYVHYTIRARLDPERHLLTGTERILYVNNSPDTLRRFYLHLYPNAYSSKNTAFLRDAAKGFNLSLLPLPEKHRSYLKLSSVSCDGRKVEPRVDETIAAFTLPEPLPPGDTMTVELRFEEKIRAHLGRAGYKGEHYDMAQWYPKVVVYDEKGFHPDVFRQGEFYGEFGDFDVYLEVPRRFVVAATGVPVEGDPGWRGADPDGKNDYKTVHFRAENVHDFAWCADPEFVVQDTTWNGVSIMSFYQKSHQDWKDTTLVHGLRAIRWLSEKFGPYPYPQVSVVDALLRGGMEYPMLVMNGRASEGLVLHEVGHIYFYGIFGNDERAEAWLDEGFTTFQTRWYFQQKYGSWGKKDKWNFYQRLTPQYTLAEKTRASLFALLRRGYGERIATRAEDFKHSYRAMVYTKASLVYDALRYVVGDEVFDRIMKEYFRRWKLKHVNEGRFRQVCEEVSGTDLGWFFEEWLHTKKTCDYRLADMKWARKREGEGYLAAVTVERKGEIVMPIEVVFFLANGGKARFRVEGRLRTITKSFELPARPVKAALNPDNNIMDINLSDNFLPRRYRLQFDWPGNSYYPEDAYQIRWRPGLWYNDLDGTKAGFHLRESYIDWDRKIKLGLYYGTKSRRVDFSASFAEPFRFMGTNGSLLVAGYKMEGRQYGNISLFFRRRKYLSIPPNHDLILGFSYHELTNRRYAVREEDYQTQPDLGPYLRYSVDPQIDLFSTRATMNLKLGRKWLGGKYHYERLSGSLVMKSRKEFVPVGIRLRLFWGVAGGAVPYQQKFHLAGAGPLAQERLFFLRSPGAIPHDLNYHLGGDGNLRGYRWGDFGVNRLLAFNIELQAALPLIGRLTGPILGPLDCTAFVDLGRSFDKDNPIATSPRIEQIAQDGLLGKTLVDAGLGLRSAKALPFYNLQLRLDFPFYVSQPRINQEKEKVAYRYLLSLDWSF